MQAFWGYGVSWLFSLALTFSFVARVLSAVLPSLLHVEHVEPVHVVRVQLEPQHVVQEPWLLSFCAASASPFSPMQKARQSLHRCASFFFRRRWASFSSPFASL